MPDIDLTPSPNQPAPADAGPASSHSRARTDGERRPKLGGSIEPSPDLFRQPSPEPAGGTGPRSADRPKTIADARPLSLQAGDLPPALASRYLIETGVLGRARVYVDATSRSPAFTDSGDRLSSTETNPNTIRDLVAVAQHRGWTCITVRGATDFRREAWMQAKAAGLEVNGYKPLQRDVQALEQCMALQRRDREPTRPAAERSPADTVEGRLTASAAAPYLRRPGEKPSHFVQIEQANGKVVELWGVGLPAALERSGVRVGEHVSLRRDGVDMVQVRIKERDPDTGTMTFATRDVPRTRWRAAAERFTEAAPAEAARDAELKAAQSHLAVVTAVAKSRLPDGPAQARVLESTKAYLAELLASGRTLSPVVVRAAERVLAGDDHPNPMKVRDGDGDRGPERTRAR